MIFYSLAYRYAESLKPDVWVIHGDEERSEEDVTEDEQKLSSGFAGGVRCRATGVPHKWQGSRQMRNDSIDWQSSQEHDGLPQSRGP
jgi:hypothetical protein